MNARELRIGNWIKYNGIGRTDVDWLIIPDQIDTVKALQFNGVVMRSNPHELGNVIALYVHTAPIPLTEEWLLKFGFTSHRSIMESFNIEVTGITMAKFEMISLSKNSDKNGYWYVYFRQRDETVNDYLHLNDLVLLKRDLMYVHQLQNLYFALTGEELQIKES